MAQIKSTLDMVLEKTKHLTLSEEEKKAQSIEIIKKSIKGIIQKYQDKKIKLQEVKSEIERLSADDHVDVKQELKKELLSRISINNDNSSSFELLSEIYTIDTTEIASIISNYTEAIKKAINQHQLKMKLILEQNHRISGAAVTPNPISDQKFIPVASEINKEYENQLFQKKLAYID